VDHLPHRGLARVGQVVQSPVDEAPDSQAAQTPEQPAEQHQRDRDVEAEGGRAAACPPEQQEPDAEERDGARDHEQRRPRLHTDEQPALVHHPDLTPHAGPMRPDERGRSRCQGRVAGGLRRDAERHGIGDTAGHRRSQVHGGAGVQLRQQGPVPAGQALSG
jgi:hypothetical protein